MPSFDRRIRITVTDPGDVDEFGETIPGAVTLETTVWAAKQDLGSGEELTESGTTIEAFDTFAIRYDSRIANAGIAFMSLYFRDDPDVDERRYYIRRVRESGRRKFLEIEAAYTSRR